MRTKTFTSSNKTEFDSECNRFLDNMMILDHQLVDIKFTIIYCGKIQMSGVHSQEDDNLIYAALVIYKTTK